MKLLSNLKNRLQGNRKVSEEERRIHAQIEYRNQERNFQRYAAELDKAIDRFKTMAYEAQKKGQHDNALKCAMFTKKLINTREKVDSVLQRFEMLYAMKGIGDMMLQFMDTCASIGCDMKEKIDIQALTSGQLSMAEGLNKLDYLSDQLEQVFNAIDDSAGLPEGVNALHSDPEAERMLADIRLEFERKNIEPAEPVMEKPISISMPAPAPKAELPFQFSDMQRRLGELQ